MESGQGKEEGKSETRRADGRGVKLRDQFTEINSETVGAPCVLTADSAASTKNGCLWREVQFKGEVRGRNSGV